MEKSLTISVITPSFNQGQFIAETIESVLMQEGEFDLEYIIVDGASTDNTLDIVKSFEQQLFSAGRPVKCNDISFRWISEKDEGQSDAIIKGFAMAKGDVIAWLNSDDTYIPGALQKIAEFFCGNPSSPVVYGKSFYTDESGRVVGRYPTGEFDRDRFPAFNFISQPSVFFTRKAYEEIGGIDKTLQFVMDYDLWIRFSQKFDLEYLPHDLSTYRLHEFSKTVSDATAYENNREVLGVVYKYFGVAPINRVLAYNFQLMKKILPVNLGRLTLLTLMLSIPPAVYKYLVMNRKIRIADIRMFTPANIRKALTGSEDLTMEKIDE